MIYAPKAIRTKFRELSETRRRELYEAAGVGLPVRYKNPKHLERVMRAVSKRLKKAQ